MNIVEHLVAEERARLTERSTTEGAAAVSFLSS